MQWSSHILCYYLESGFSIKDPFTNKPYIFFRRHHCYNIKYSLHSFDNCLNLSLIKSVFKCVNKLAPDSIRQLIIKQSL